MEFAFLIFIFLIAGGLLLWYLERCPHSWTLVNRGLTRRKIDDTPIGEFAVYECVHCKKMKTEEVEY